MDFFSQKTVRADHAELGHWCPQQTWWMSDGHAFNFPFRPKPELFQKVIEKVSPLNGPYFVAFITDTQRVCMGECVYGRIGVGHSRF